MDKKHHKNLVKELNPKFKVQDFRKTIKEEDSHNTLFLLDPPWRCGKTKNKDFESTCDIGLVPKAIETCKNTKGTCVVTISSKYNSQYNDVLCKSPFKCYKVNNCVMWNKDKKGCRAKVGVLVGVKP